MFLLKGERAPAPGSGAPASLLTSEGPQGASLPQGPPARWRLFPPTSDPPRGWGPGPQSRGAATRTTRGTRSSLLQGHHGAGRSSSHGAGTPSGCGLGRLGPLPDAGATHRRRRPARVLVRPRGFNRRGAGQQLRGKAPRGAAPRAGRAHLRPPARDPQRPLQPPDVARNWPLRATPGGRAVTQVGAGGTPGQVKLAPGLMLTQSSWGGNATVGCAGHRTVTADLPSEWHVHFVTTVTITESRRRVLRSGPV